MVDLEYEVLNEKFVTVSKAKDILDSVEDKNYEQKLAHEHTKKFGKTKAKKIKDLKEALEKLDMRRLKEKWIIKIIDLMPEDIEDLKVILRRAEVSFKEEEIKKIMETLKNV